MPRKARVQNECWALSAE